MPTPTDPQMIQVPVERIDINLTLEDLLTPLTNIHTRHTQAKLLVPGSDVDQDVKQLAQLAKQLKDVASRIQRANPSLLVSPSANTKK